MMTAPSDASEQAVLAMQLGSGIPAGTLVHVASSDGTPVATYEAAKVVETLIVSTPDLVTGETYEVFFDGSVAGESLGGLYLESDYAGGTSAGTLAAY